jgi:hypothetical protein
MVKSITAVQSQAGTGLITFNVNVDANGCDEDFSVAIDGTKATNHVKHSAADTPGASIQTTKGGVGNRNISIQAETSNVSSTAKLINL